MCTYGCAIKHLIAVLRCARVWTMAGWSRLKEPQDYDDVIKEIGVLWCQHTMVRETSILVPATD